MLSRMPRAAERAAWMQDTSEFGLSRANAR
jgi:hypothetical protein